MDSNIIKKANDIIKNATEGYVGVIDEEHYPSVATRSIIKPINIFECYFSTGIDGNLATRVKKNSKASVCIRDKNNNISLLGDFEIITDNALKKEMWLDWFINHYKEGVDDPIYCLLKFTTRKVSLWMDGESSEFYVSDLKKAQSRCGLLCDPCTYKESHSCGSCIKTNGHPFHGECPVAICCQERGFVHCGQCSDMPCEKLYEYSCGVSEHCDRPKGARLEMLRMWKDNE